MSSLLTKEMFYMFAKVSIVNECIFLFFSLIHTIVLYPSIVKDQVQGSKHRNRCPMYKYMSNVVEVELESSLAFF